MRRCRRLIRCAPPSRVPRYKDMKNKSFKELREKLQGSCRFFLGSNKVLQVALDLPFFGDACGSPIIIAFCVMEDLLIVSCP